MIAVDASALMAMVLNEAGADDCAASLEAGNHVSISAAMVAEALIVACEVAKNERRLSSPVPTRT